MARSMFSQAMVTATAAVLLTVAGCTQQQQQQVVVKKTEPAVTKPAAPAPAPAAKPAAPAPAPAPAPVVASGTSMAFPTGDRNTSAILVETLMPREVRANQPFTYDINVTNLTGGPVQNVVLTAANFQNLNVASTNPAISGPATGAACGPNGVSWNLGDIAARGTKTIKVTATAPATGASSNCFTVSYNNCLCVGTNVVNPAIALTKKAPAEVLVCDSFDYTFEVKNTGTGAADNVVIKDTLPAGVTTADGKSSVEIPVGSLASGASATKTIRVKAGKPGKYDNNASAVADGGLTANSGTVSTVVRQPQLTLTETCTQQIFLGRDAAFEYTATNTGDAACNAVLTATIPAGASFVSASDSGAATAGNVTWQLGALAPGQKKTVKATFKPSAGVGALKSDSTVTCPCSNTANASCTTNVVGIPAQLLDGRDDPDPVQVGSNVTYTLEVTNQGSLTLTNVKLVCTMDGSTMQYVSSTGPTNGTAAGTVLTFAPIPSLAPGAKQTYKVVVKAIKAGQVSFKSESSSDQITVPLRKDETTNFYE